MSETTLGQRICAKRNELGLSQNALGEQLGVSRQSVFKWESDAAIPEIDKLIALSRLFGVSIGWLLGIEEQPGAEGQAREEPLRDFTERERQILEQLSQRKAIVPRWLKALAIIAVSCAAVAMINSCISLHLSSRSSARTEELVAYVQSRLEDWAYVVQDFDYGCTPSYDMGSAEIWMRVTPYTWQEGDQASLTVLLGEEVMGIYDCLWNGASWETEVQLNAANGYRFLFRLTDNAGNELTQELHADMLGQLTLNLSWPTDYSIKWKSLHDGSGCLSFTDMTLDIPLPGIFRAMDDVWSQCDLVLLGPEGELCRVDLMHRSQYSAQIDFSGSDVSFTTRSVEMSFPEPAIGDTLTLQLQCGLTTGHVFLCPVEVWEVTAGGLSAVK